MKAVIHQPDFLPYLGFFHRLLFCDALAVLDSVQFVSRTKNAWHYRDKIKGPQGEAWITVGVEKAPLGTKIQDIQLRSERAWRERMFQQIEQYYRKARFYGEIRPFCEKIISYEASSMSDFNWNSIKVLMDLFDIRIPTVWTSALEVTGRSNELVINILKKIGAEIYLSGVGAKAYHDDHLYAEAGIEVYWQNFIHPQYSQLHGDFIPYLSSIDLLFNCGVENSRKILRECGSFVNSSGEILK